MEAILWFIDVWLIGDLIRTLSKRTKTRRQIRQWLEELNLVQKQLLETCVLAASSSTRRKFELPKESIGCYFEAQCALLLDTGAVTASKYPAPGTRSYRFESWLYDYLTRYPELLEMDHPPIKSAVVLQDIIAETGAGSQLLASRDPVVELEAAYQNYVAALDLLAEVQESGADEMLDDAIQACSSALGSLYVAHGSPFGPTENARFLWEVFDLWTTSN